MATTAEIQSMIRSTALTYGVDPALALAVAQRESSFNPAAVGSKGEVGIFQLSSAAAQDVGVNRNILEGNITGGVLYLRQMLDRFGDPELALAAYNVGQGNVSRGIIPLSTQAYVSNVLSTAGYYGYGAEPGADEYGTEPVFRTTVWGTPFEIPSEVLDLLPWLAGGAIVLLLVSLSRRRSA